MLRLLVVPLFSLLLQDEKAITASQRLKWSLSERTSLECSWKGRFKIVNLLDGRETPGANVEFEASGTLDLQAADDEEAAGEVRLRKLLLRGPYRGSTFDLFVEDGKVQRPTGTLPDAAKALLDRFLMPAQVKVSTLGRYQPDLSNPFWSSLGGIWPLLGPVLPSSRVRPGDAWKVPLPVPDGRGASEPITVTYKLLETLEGKQGKVAKISVNDSIKAKIQGFDIELILVGIASFDITNGRCLSDSLKGEVTQTGQWEGKQVEATAKFEMTLEIDAAKK